MDFGHHRIAGVDAEAALDAAELRALADVDSSGTDGDALVAVDAVAGGLPMRMRLGGVLHRHARLAAIEAIGDVERVVVGQRRLNARPRAHVEADLLAHMAGERIGGEGEDACPEIGDERRPEGGELPQQRRGVDEIEHRRAAGQQRDHEPRAVLGDALDDLVGSQGRRIELDPVAPVALDRPLHPEEQVGPYRLWAGVAAPRAADQRIGQEQGQRRKDQEAGEVIDLLRPQLDEERVEAGMRNIDEHRLARRIRSTIPAYEREQVVDAEGDPQHNPLYAPVGRPRPFAGRPWAPPHTMDLRRRRTPQRRSSLAATRTLTARRRGCGHRSRAT